MAAATRARRWKASIPAPGSGTSSARSAPSVALSIPPPRSKAPGVIRHVYGDRFPLGEPSGEDTSDVRALAGLFTAAGMQAPVLDRIRDEIWLKLWGNVCLNPISALTCATLDVICTDPATRALSKAIMLETQAIAETFGVKFRVDVERRIEGARKVGAHKTSMLQDLERGRPMEIDPLVSVVQEMGAADRNPDAGARCGAGAGGAARQARRALRKRPAFAAKAPAFA